MKKFFALILTVVMLATLFPASVVTHAKGGEKPFYVVNWSAPGNKKQYIYGMPGSNVNEDKITDSTAADSVAVTVGSYGSDIKTIARNMKEDFDKRPAGTRYINFAAQRALFLAKCKDLVDLRHGVELTKNWLTALLTEYKALGGELDGILLDLEYNDATVYYINANYYSNKKNPNKNIYNEIAANEYYKTVLRPQLVERGFVFYENPDPVKYPYRSELWTIENGSEDGANSKSQNIWNQLIQEHQANAMTEAVYKPLIQFYPNAVVSDYKTGDSYSWYKGMGHTGSESGYNTIKAGNTSNYNFYDYATGYLFYGYGSETNRAKRTKYQKPASYNGAYFADAPYSRTNWEVNTMKRLLASTDTGKVNAWITFFSYGSYGPGYSRTPYYSELIYHLGMTDPEPFIGYILPGDVNSKDFGDFDPYQSKFDYTLKIVEELMAELTRVAGYSDRKTIVTPITWNEGFFLSGMYAGGRNIWRLTPDTTEISVKDFKVKDAEPTFSVNGVTVTFPKGKIIEDSVITEVGTCGYWIETPADVTPVVTAAADRYEKDPSFHETFDYATGKFTSDSALPNTFWTVSGNAAIGKGEGMSWLELTGNASVINTKVPQLITAGDYYAKQQVWEVEVSISPSLGSYGEIILLSAGGSDGGVKLSGGKVYYDHAGAYKEMSSVKLEDGNALGKYVIKREMDFRTEGAYTCTYTIRDAVANQTLAVIENVPVAIPKIPVTDISIAVKGAGSKVLLDDFKLYPAGLTTNLDLYDATYGRTLADPTAPQTADTAYRLSWMNASGQYKVARIYDAKSGATLKQVEMAPGMDGVVTGIAEAGAGSPVQIVVDVQDKAVFDSIDPVPGATEGADGTGGTEGTPGKVPGADAPAVDGNTDGASNVDGADNPGNVDVQKNGVSGGIIALIVILSMAILAGGVTVFVFVLKPKLFAGTHKESTEE